MTLIELVEQASARLDAAGVAFGHGTDNAFDEAAWLVLWQLRLALHDLDAQSARPVSADELDLVGALIDRRIRTRQPAAYLTGEAWLLGVPFHIDRRAIVPRSMIAEPLVQGVLDAWMAAPPRRVLDLCTGNGSLAVLAAMAWPEASLLATDLSPDALAVARLNVERHGLQARVELAQGDGLAAVRGRFDLILCNPPYVNADSMAALPPEFQAEPVLALHGGEDGMDFVRTLLAGVARHLGDSGLLVLEIGHGRAQFEAAFPQLSVVWLPTSAGDDQVLLVASAALP